MDKKKSKENGVLCHLVDLDKSVSQSLSLSASKKSPLGHLRSHMKALEYSCHGLVWIPASVIGIWFSNTLQREAFFFNLLLALLLDVIFVAVLKASIHRRRPAYNKDDMFMTISIDKMSCPSGHTSRVVLLTFLLLSSTPGWHLFRLILVVWCFCTSTSRVLLGRHYVGDVIIGAILGYMEYLIMDYVWAGPETADWYLSFFRDSGSILDEF